nr:hypothetical protein [uncultured Cohaesibacter sp.]
MRGELIGVQGYLFSELFETLLEEIEEGAEELAIDLFRGVVPQPKQPEKPELVDFNDDGELYRPEDIEARDGYREALERHTAAMQRHTDASSDAGLAFQLLKEFLEAEETSEAMTIKALEAAFEPIDEFGGDALSNQYFKLVGGVLEKYSLRYDLRRPMTLHPTLPGIFAKLISELRLSAQANEALKLMLDDFDEAIRDIRDDRSSRRIRQCIEAEFKLLEELAAGVPGIKRDSLGMMTLNINSWPHATVQASISKLYGFASNYPGIRHAGNPRGKLREVDMRDLVSLGVVLAGFTPYLSENIDFDRVFMDK